MSRPAVEPGPQRIAEAVRDAMLAKVRASRSLGMQVEAIGPGRATLCMTVRHEMLNGLDICHGGLITTLADSAFAFACNSHNVLTVAASLAVDLIAPAREGDVLTAQAIEVSRSGRTGVYDAVVSNQRGECVALLRGRSHSLKGRAVVDLPPV